MGIWSFYFLGKLYLYVRGHIKFDFILNFLFLLFLLIPIPRTLPYQRLLKSVRLTLGIVFAFLLLWHDSWFPPLLHSVRLLKETGGISVGYIATFLKDAVNFLEILVLLAMLGVVIFLQRRVTLTPFVFILVLLVPIAGLRQKTSHNLDGHIESFFSSEAKRAVRFEPPGAQAPDFDIILLHICSLAWDDMAAVGLDKEPFLKQFDILFSRFNTVSSYTNPSAIRLLRSNCGQTRHGDLYRVTRPECYLLGTLRSQGYQTYTAIDNDALRFPEDLMAHGAADAPMSRHDIPVMQYDFDNTPIYDDLAILRKWWDLRQASAVKKAALYFDSTTMHGGAHWADDKEWWKKERPVHYREFGLNLFKNLNTFFDMIAASGRNAVVVFVPEHGMALRGSSIQPPDLRDIPLPQITLVPVGIKLIGSGFGPVPARQEIVSKPLSYLALAHVLAAFVKDPPFPAGRSRLSDIIAEIPETPFLSENEGVIVAQKEADYFLFGKDKKWVRLGPSVVPQTDTLISGR